MMRKYSAENNSVGDLDVFLRGLAESAKIGVDGGGLTEDEPRHETENGIIDFAVFRDPNGGGAAARLQGICPRAGIREPGGGDAAFYRCGRMTIEDFVGDRFTIARRLALKCAATFARDSFELDDIGTPILRAGDEREQFFRRRAKWGGAGSDMLLGEQVADTDDHDDEQDKYAEDNQDNFHQSRSLFRRRSMMAAYFARHSMPLSADSNSFERISRNISRTRSGSRIEFCSRTRAPRGVSRNPTQRASDLSRVRAM